jgi:comEA protein
VLDAVPGIGPAVLEGLSDHVTFSGTPRNRSGKNPRIRVILSTATADELAQLPGIGPARARAIVEDRKLHGRYRSIDELRRVSGIGPATLDRLRGLVVP